MIVIKAGPYLQDTLARAPPGGGSVLDAVSRSLFALIYWSIRPLEGQSPMESLAAGHLIPWAEVGIAGLVRLVVYAGVLAAFGSWIFSRREIAVGR